MDKLLWVALPLLAFGAWLGWRAWRGRMPPRLALNVLTRVWLLAYLCITVGSDLAPLPMIFGH